MWSGSVIVSSVAPRQNSPGWITNGSSGPIVCGSVRLRGGSRRSIAEARWLWKTRKLSPRRRSTLAGWTSDGSQGSITIVPSSTSRRIVPSDSTDDTVTGAPTSATRSAPDLAGARIHAAHAARCRQWLGAVRAAPGRTRYPRPRMGVEAELGAATTAVLTSRLLLLVLTAQRAPDE